MRLVTFIFFFYTLDDWWRQWLNNIAGDTFQHISYDSPSHAPVLRKISEENISSALRLYTPFFVLYGFIFQLNKFATKNKNRL
jgi:hypothetical protein